MVVTEVTRYMAYDGKEFKNKEYVQQHVVEQVQEFFTDRLEKHLVEKDGMSVDQLKRVVTVMVENITEVKELVDFFNLVGN